MSASTSCGQKPVNAYGWSVPILLQKSFCTCDQNFFWLYTALEHICLAKAMHVEENWQDVKSAKLWTRHGRLCGTAACKVGEAQKSFGNFRADIRCKMIIGYARASSDEQTLDAQLANLKAAGAERIFSEKVSGAKTNRRELQRAIAALSEGDVLLVTRLDRLARSTRDLLNVLATISEKGAGFRSLADAMIDTTPPHGKLIIAVLGALAEFERSMILARTAEGRKRAQTRGVRFGRKPKLTPHQIAEAIARGQAGEPLTEIGRSYNVSNSTISKLSTTS
jgi:DNA invertase Pin-like site-specific DNA recombinase